MKFSSISPGSPWAQLMGSIVSFFVEYNKLCKIESCDPGNENCEKFSMCPFESLQHLSYDPLLCHEYFCHIHNFHDGFFSSLTLYLKRRYLINIPNSAFLNGAQYWPFSPLRVFLPSIKISATTEPLKEQKVILILVTLT